MTLKIESIARVMLVAARGAITDRWPAARSLAELEFRKIADTLVDVQQMLARGEIDTERARELVHMQQNSALGAIASIKGLGLLTARLAVDTAMTGAARIVNQAVGFRLLVGALPAATSQPETPNATTEPVKEKGHAATRQPARAKRTAATSTEQADETSPNFKAGRDL